jgi:hypothetical protein
MMYMLLFYGDDEKMKEILTDPAELMNRHVQFNRMVQERSRLVYAHALQPHRETVTVRPEADGMTAAAGAATDARTTLNGFYLINCKDQDEAVEIAKLYPMPEGLGYVEVRPTIQEWKTAPIADSSAAPEEIWSFYRDAASWPQWMSEVESVRLEGVFAAGTSGEITMADGTVRALRIATVAESKSFTMEIELAPNIWLWVGHYLMPLPSGETRITHEPVVPHAALDVLGLHFTQTVNAQAKTSVETLAELAVSNEQKAKASADAGA